jgi:LuxR family transcriptional regulator, maltose regulon positive regulatory protein
MTSYFLPDSLDSSESYSPPQVPSAGKRPGTERDDVHIVREKLHLPGKRSLVKRPRLEGVLRKSVAQFSATLISGRAGTGKTAVAAEFARKQDHAAWYSVESSDIDWNVFAHYFATSVLGSVKSKMGVHDVLPDEIHASQSVIATFLINVFAEVETVLLHQPLTIVIDDIHHLFDADWFGEFFSLLLSSLPDNAHMILICRSKPPNPLWRMRSKQQLNVIDEKLLAFDLVETVELMRRAGLARSYAERAHSATFGRISKLIETTKRAG